MKRLLLIVNALLLVMAAKAQSFEFRFHGTSVADGETVVIPAVEDEFGFGELWCETNPSDNPNNGLILKLLSAAEATGCAILNIESNTLDASTVKWCMGGECTLMKDKTTDTKSFTTQDGTAQVLFDAENIKNKGRLQATLQVTIGAESHSVKILFTNGDTDAGDDAPFWWGYFTDSNIAELDFSGYLGLGSAATIDAAICIPANHPIAGGGTIKGVRLWFGDDISAINSDVTVWISTSLPAFTSKAKYTQTIARSDLHARLNEIELTTPYVINNGECYIGFSLSISKRSYPIMGAGEDEPNACFYRVGGNSWEDCYGEDYGRLALQVLLDGIVRDDYSVVTEDFGTAYVEKGKTVCVPVKILNIGKNTIHSIAYTITTGDETSDEQTFSFEETPFNESRKLAIPLPSDSDAKKYAKTVTITKVDGVPNQSAAKAAHGALITVVEKPAVVPVVEEFTGTWCGWCPVGFDGLEKTYELYGDRVALIAAHYSDPMEISDYNPIFSNVSGFPSSFINRSIDAYPTAKNLPYYLDSELERAVVAGMETTAMWSDEKQQSILIDTQTRFVYSDDNGQYSLAYVLVEDGMKGTGSDWAQSNYLSGRAGYEDYTFWYNAASSVTGLKFNHVAVAAWEIQDGVSGSINSKITAGETQIYRFNASIANKKTIQDKSKLKVIVLLIDNSNGKIVNAAQTLIQDTHPDAIRPPFCSPEGEETEAFPREGLDEASWYDLQGRKIEKMVRAGVYIVNGRKVVIK